MKPASSPKMLLAELEQALHSVPLNHDLVFDLIQRGADPNFQEKAGEESFFSEFLCEWSDSPVFLEAVKLLLEAGANPNHDPGDGIRPLCNACNARRPDLVAALLQFGADPNFIIEEHESLLDDVEFDHWIDEEDIGTASEKDHLRGSVEKLGEILNLLRAAGAKSMSDMTARELKEWVHLWPGSPEKMLTCTGYISIDGIPGLSGPWKARWRDWCRRNFHPARGQSILDTPAGFDRRVYNREGLGLAREFKPVAGDDVRVDLLLLDPDDEEAFAINCYQIKDVGASEKPPSLAYPFSQYAKTPGFHLETKAAVPPDLANVDVVFEFFAHGERYHPELKLNFDELKRSVRGDGRYAMFQDAAGGVVAVDVLWGEESVLWSVALSTGTEQLAFLREKYAEVIEDAQKWAFHTERRARIAIERFKNRVPTLTCTGQIQLSGSLRRDKKWKVSEYTPAGPEVKLMSRSRIWEICVIFAAAINQRNPGLVAGRMAGNACFTGDRRSEINGKESILDYLQIAFAELEDRTDGNRVWAEVGYFWLTGEPCVLLWEGGEAVALANVRSNSDRMFTSCHWMTERGLVQSVQGTRVFPAGQTSSVMPG